MVTPTLPKVHRHNIRQGLIIVANASCRTSIDYFQTFSTFPVPRLRLIHSLPHSATFAISTERDYKWLRSNEGASRDANSRAQSPETTAVSVSTETQIYMASNYCPIQTAYQMECKFAALICTMPTTTTSPADRTVVGIRARKLRDPLTNAPRHPCHVA